MTSAGLQRRQISLSIQSCLVWQVIEQVAGKHRAPARTLGNADANFTLQSKYLRDFQRPRIAAVKKMAIALNMM
jgi:hypothetical protein